MLDRVYEFQVFKSSEQWFWRLVAHGSVTVYESAQGHRFRHEAEKNAQDIRSAIGAARVKIVR